MRNTLTAAIFLGGVFFPSLGAEFQGKPEFPCEVLSPPQYSASDSEIICLVPDPSNEGERYQIQNRWPGAEGTPKFLTWSFVPDGLPISVAGSPTSSLFAQMDELFEDQGGRAVWIARFEEAFSRWANLAGISYLRVQDGTNDWDDGAPWGAEGAELRGDVRIALVPLLNGAAAQNSYPPYGDMMLSTGIQWSSCPNGNSFLRDVIAHEHGHGMGLRHVCSTDSYQVMEPVINTIFLDGPQDDGIRGAQRLYGDIYEENDTAETAADLGVLIPGSFRHIGPIPPPIVRFASTLSIDANGDVDYY